MKWFYFKYMSKRIYRLCQTRWALKRAIGIVCCALVSMMASVSGAKDLGVNGEVFAIKEPSLLETIHERLHAWQRNGVMDDKLKTLIQRITQHFENLPRLPHLTPVTVTRTRFLTPRYEITRPYFGQQDEVLAMPSDILLPLQHVRLTRPLIFFDATREKEWRWLEAFLKTLNKKQPMIIIVAGNLKHAMAHFHEVYDDFDGRLTKRLQVTHTPTLVTQVNDALQLKEIAL